MKRLGLWVLLGYFLTGTLCAAQQTLPSEGPFDRKNSWTLLADFSNTSSHIIAGAARKRELVTLGGAYTRRVARFAGTELGYRIELRPVVFESDPLVLVQATYTGGTDQSYATTAVPVGVCRPSTSSFTIQQPAPGPPETVTVTGMCGRRWTFGQSFTPFGVRYSLGYRHRVQPYVLGTLGYMYTSRPVPVVNAEAFNFVVDAGAGLEVFRAGRRSISLEVRAHHFSNRDTAQANPGTDNVMYGISYSFGR